MASFLSDFSSHSQIWDEAAWEALHNESLLFSTSLEQPRGHHDTGAEMTQSLALPIIQTLDRVKDQTSWEFVAVDPSDTQAEYACHCCKAVYQQKHNLITHIQRKHGAQQLEARIDLKKKEKAKPFRCPVENCLFSYATKGSLRSHCWTQHNQALDGEVSKFEQPFPCPHEDCLSGLKSRKAFIQHLKNIHNQELRGNKVVDKSSA